jgi:hypothetical protein
MLGARPLPADVSMRPPGGAALKPRAAVADEIHVDRHGRMSDAVVAEARR